MEEKTLTINLEPARYTRQNIVEMIDQINKAIGDPKKPRLIKVVIVDTSADVQPQTIIAEGAGDGPYSAFGGGNVQPQA